MSTPIHDDIMRMTQEDMVNEIMSLREALEKARKCLDEVRNLLLGEEMIKPDHEEEYEERQRERHEGGLCEGAPVCGYCLDDLDEREEEEKHEGSREDSFGNLVKD